MNPRHLCLSFGLSALALSAVAAVADTFTPPEGCTGYVTVQSKGCKLSNHYRCTGDAPGDQWRVDFGPQGAYFASRIDAETQWVHSIDLSPERHQWLAPAPADPASFSDLLRAGTDTFDFKLQHEDGSVTRVRGFDTLTGREVVIDGVRLKETSFEFREVAVDGTQIARARGNEYIHPEWRLFLSGPSEWESGGSYSPVDHSPVEFVFPGEPGFFSTKPRHGCDALMSGAPLAVVPVRGLR
jgi:hypothetical protein